MENIHIFMRIRAFQTCLLLSQLINYTFRAIKITVIVNRNFNVSKWILDLDG